MDSQLFRLNQMSYQHHLLSQQQHLNRQQQQQRPNTNNRQHYSNRQVAQATTTAATKLAAGHTTATTSGSGSGSDQDEQVQLSSLSTATNKTLGSGSSSANSQAAILGPQHHQQQSKRAHEQHQQHQLMMAKHRQQQHHRQAALQAQTLAVPGGHNKASNGERAAPGGAKLLLAGSSSSDQLTTSSDQTIDDLHHHLNRSASGSHHHHHLQAHPHNHHHNHHLMRYPDPSTQTGGRFQLGVLFTFAELLLFATVCLWLYWAYQHDDGLAWQSDRRQQFNTHAALMLFGFVFLSGQAMLIHRSFACCSKIYTKILHTILFVLASSAISLGLILAYTAQENVGANNKPIMHFYSLHAWCGLVTCGLFVLQFVFGFVSFLILLCCDQATSNYRAALLPIHRTFGLIIFSLAVATSLMGLLQTARSRLSSKLNKTDYHELAEPGILINLIGCCLICLAILMPYIIRNLNIKPAQSSSTSAGFKTQLDRHLKSSSSSHKHLAHLGMRI